MCLTFFLSPDVLFARVFKMATIRVVKVRSKFNRSDKMKAKYSAFVLLLNIPKLSICAVSGLYTPFVFVYEKATKEIGVSTGNASLILSLLGIFNTVGRLIAGWLADRPWADSLVIYNVSAIVAGLLTCSVSMMFSFELLCVYAVLFGILIGLHQKTILF